MIGRGSARRLVWSLARSGLVTNRHRQELFRLMGLDNLGSTWVGPQVTMVVPEEVAAGEGCYINEGAFLDRHVTLGANVYIGPRAMLITASHAVGGASLRAAAGAPDPVLVGDGCWIGAGAIVLPGVVVGAGCVIAAGAVVTRSCDPNGLYAGVPARRVRDLPDEPEAP